MKFPMLKRNKEHYKFEEWDFVDETPMFVGDKEQYKKGYKKGISAGRQNYFNYFNYDNLDKSQSYITGFKKGYIAITESVIREGDKVQYKKGYHAGYHAVRMGYPLSNELLGQSQDYINGYNKGYTSANRSKNCMPASEEQVLFRKGQLAGYQAAWMGRLRNSHLRNQAQSFSDGYEQSYSKTSATINQEKIQLNKGKFAALVTLYRGHSRRTNFQNNSLDFRTGYNQTYDLALVKKKFYFIWREEEKHLFKSNGPLKLICYQYPFSDDKVLYYFEEGCSRRLTSCFSLIKKNPGLTELMIHSFRARAFAKNLESQRQSILKIIPQEQQKNTEKIKALGPFVILKKFELLKQLLDENELPNGVLGKSGDSASYPVLPERIKKELLHYEYITIQCFSSDNERELDENDPEFIKFLESDFDYEYVANILNIKIPDCLGTKTARPCINLTTQSSAATDSIRANTIEYTTIQCFSSDNECELDENDPEFIKFLESDFDYEYVANILNIKIPDCLGTKTARPCINLTTQSSAATDSTRANTILSNNHYYQDTQLSSVNSKSPIFVEEKTSFLSTQSLTSSPTLKNNLISDSYYHSNPLFFSRNIQIKHSEKDQLTEENSLKKAKISY